MAPIIQQHPIQISDLRSAIASQVHQIGEPVSARVHISIQDRLTEWSMPVKIAESVVIAAFNDETFEWRSRNDGSGRLSNRLGESSKGKTALVTLARGYENLISVTIFGNHGTLRFEESRFSVGND